MHVQSVQIYCFSLSNTQICDVVVASSSWLRKLPNAAAKTTVKIISPKVLKVIVLNLMLNCKLSMQQQQQMMLEADG